MKYTSCFERPKKSFLNNTQSTTIMTNTTNTEEEDKNFYDKCMDKKGCEIGFYVVLVIVSLLTLYCCFYCFCSGYLGY